MPIAFTRSVCCNLHETIAREWLITNGQGGYAAGTVAGVLTRMQHGLLVAPLAGASVPQLLLAKIDEEVVFDQRTYYLGTNEYSDGTLNPNGFVHLETFRLEEGFPIFTYRLGGIDGVLLEKRIWMPHGDHTTCIQYRVLRREGIADTSPGPAASLYGLSQRENSGRAGGDRSFRRHSSYAEQRALILTLLPFSAYRPFDQPQHGDLAWHFQVRHGQEALPESLSLPAGVAVCTVRAWEGAPAFSIFAVGHEDSATTFIPTNVWYWHVLRRHDQAAGRAAVDDLYLPGVMRAKLWPGEDSTLTVIVSSEELSASTQIPRPSQCSLSFKRSIAGQRDILQPQRYFGVGGIMYYYGHMSPLPPRSLAVDTSSIGEEEFLRLLVQAAERFLIRCETSSTAVAPAPAHKPFSFCAPERMSTILADYYSLTESTRDALLALPGLALATRRFDAARSVLRNLARYFQQGLLPDRLPSPGQSLEEEDYNGADTTLWFFYALDHYLRNTYDYELLDELYPRLVDSIAWHLRGTFNAIVVDAADGLLSAYHPHRALTWMNATIAGCPITQRGGKTVEVNALWHHALSLMQEWSQYRQRRGQMGPTPEYYAELSQRCKESFNQRFWHSRGGYLYDGIDGPHGADAALRPNQLLAVSLRYQVLDMERWQEVCDTVTRHLLTPYGLRSLAIFETGYLGQPGAGQEEQLRALHQGSSWPWLIGPYVDALLNIARASGTTRRSTHRQQADWWHKGLQLLEAFHMHDLHKGILGMVGGVFSGDQPHRLGYVPTSAAAIGEILRVYNLLAQNAFCQSDDLLSARRTSQGRSS